jgi:hypothetical protein
MESAVEKSQSPRGQKKISSRIYDYVICSLKSVAGVIPSKNTTPSSKTGTLAPSQKYTAQKNVGFASKVCSFFFSIFGFFHGKLFKRTNVVLEKRGDLAKNGPIVEKKPSAPLAPPSIAATSKSTKKELLPSLNTQSKTTSESTKKELLPSLNTQSKTTSESTKKEFLPSLNTQSKTTSESTKKELLPAQSTQSKVASESTKKELLPAQSTQSKVASESIKRELLPFLNTQSKTTSESTKKELLPAQSTQSNVASEGTKKELSPSSHTKASAEATSTTSKKDSAPSKEEPKKKSVSWIDSAMGEKSACATESIILRFPFAPPTKQSAEVQTDPPVEADLKPVNFPKAHKQEREGHHSEDFYIHPPRSNSHSRARATPVRPPSPDLFDQTGDFFMGLVKEVSTVFEKLHPNSDKSVAASTRPPSEKETFFSL